MSSSTRREGEPRGIFNLTRCAIHTVGIFCWLGIAAALTALPVVVSTPAWLLGSIEPAVVAAHGDGPHLLLHFCAGLLVIVLLLALGLVFLRQLQRFVASIGQRQPFTDGNVRRLRRMAWLMLVMELLSILIGLYATWMGPPFAWMEIGGGMSITGLIAVLMLFVMAHVFAVGTAMREDLDRVV
mgnify:CR=1 FL=1